MGVYRHRLVERVEDIPVFPEVCSYKYKWSTSFLNIPVCEDDDGAICFPSKKTKERFLEKYHAE